MSFLRVSSPSFGGSFSRKQTKKKCPLHSVIHDYPPGLPLILFDLVSLLFPGSHTGSDPVRPGGNGRSAKSFPFLISLCVPFDTLNYHPRVPVRTDRLTVTGTQGVLGPVEGVTAVKGRHATVRSFVKSERDGDKEVEFIPRLLWLESPRNTPNQLYDLNSYKR